MNSHKSLYINALDALALALSNHGHVWTDDERRYYEEAIASLTSSSLWLGLWFVGFKLMPS